MTSGRPRMEKTTRQSAPDKVTENHRHLKISQSLGCASSVHTIIREDPGRGCTPRISVADSRHLRVEETEFSRGRGVSRNQTIATRVYVG